MSYMRITPPPVEVDGPFEHGMTLISDIHFGARDFKVKILRDDLDAAREHGDRVYINGDVFDAILWTDKKRFVPDVMPDKLAGSSAVLNDVLDMATDILSPYADLIWGVGVGNHEISVEKYHSVDLVALLIERLAARAGHPVYYMNVGGVISTRFVRANSGKSAMTHNLFYHHGTGASPGKNRSMLTFDSLASWLGGNVDTIWLGHTHDKNPVTLNTKLHVPADGSEPYLQQQLWVMSGAYTAPMEFRKTKPDGMRARGRNGNYATDGVRARPRATGGVRLIVKGSLDGRRSMRQLVPVEV
jgi:hypothetical protein